MDSVRTEIEKAAEDIFVPHVKCVRCGHIGQPLSIKDSNNHVCEKCACSLPKYPDGSFKYCLTFPKEFDTMIKCNYCKCKLGVNSQCPYCMDSLKPNFKENIPHSSQSIDPCHWQHDYVRLTSGVKFYLKNPSKTKGLRVVDLIVPIAEISRYNFHLSTHYSVAEHCYYCSQRCSNPLYALLHDLSEAIIGDLPAPVKVLCPDYKKVELKVEKWIFEVFGLDPMCPPHDMKKVDKRVLATEQLHFGRTADSIETYPPYMDLRIGCWKPVYAVLRYFERLQELTQNKYALDTVLEMPEKPDSYFEG